MGFSVRRHALSLLVVCAFGCGARTPLASGNGGDNGTGPDAAVTCTATFPWVVFDATRKNPNGTGFVTSLAAMRVDGTERHLLGPMNVPSTSSSWFATFADGSMMYRASHGGYELRRYALANGADTLLFQRPGSGPSVGPGVLSADGARVAYMDWYHLALASSDGTGTKQLVNDCATCVPLELTPDGAAVWVYALRSLQRIPVNGAPLVIAAAPVVAPPALDRDQARVAAVVQCGGPVPARSLRIFDLDPNGGTVATCAGDAPGGILVATIGGFQNVSRVAWSADDWLAFDVDATLEVVSPSRTVTTLDLGPDVKAFNATLAEPCARLPAGPSL